MVDGSQGLDPWHDEIILTVEVDKIGTMHGIVLIIPLDLLGKRCSSFSILLDPDGKSMPKVDERRP